MDSPTLARNTMNHSVLKPIFGVGSVVMVLILLVRPYGLFGTREVRRV